VPIQQTGGSIKWAVALTALALTAGAWGIHHAAGKIQPERNLANLAEALDVIAGQSDPGSMIFITDWDLFPQCFYYNHHNTYPCGLDPMFMKLHDPQKWDAYCDITLGRAATNAVPNGAFEGNGVSLAAISSLFQAEWVLLPASSSRLFEQMNQHANLFQRVYPTAEYRMDGQPPFTAYRIVSDASPLDPSQI